MKRREAIAVISGTAAYWSLPSRAQQNRIPIIGFLGSGSPYKAEDSGWVGTQRGLAETGYFDGQNLACTYRFSEGHDDRSPEFAEELVRLNVDVIAASGNSSAALAAKHATATIPIVFITGADPVGTGLVDSLAHPGGNITGVTLISADLNRKRLELLAELVPAAKSIGLLVNPNNPQNEKRIRELHDLAQQIGVHLEIAQTADKADFDTAIATLVKAKVGAATVLSDTMYMSNRQPLIDTAARYTLPMIYETRDFAVLGGLIGYGTDLLALGHRFGTYLGRVLNGAKAADLPVEQATKFQLVVNQRTAKAQGITIPPAILARADEVID